MIMECPLSNELISNWILARFWHTSIMRRRQLVPDIEELPALGSESGDEIVVHVHQRGAASGPRLIARTILQ